MPAGTITLTNNSASVTGSGTSFTTELKANDFIVTMIGGVTYTLGIRSVDSDGGLTLTRVFDGPTSSGVAWTALPNAAIVGITAQIAADVARSIRGLNLDKANWQKLLTGTGNQTITLPDGSTYTGRAWSGLAANGDNNDISSLSALSDGLVLRGVNSAEGLGNGVVFESTNTTEGSFGVSNIAGGSAVFHNYKKNADASPIGDNQLIGGYGSRPWTGATYTEHSNTAIHFMMDGTASSTNHGGWTRILTCPKNKTQESRRQTFAASNTGDLWIGYDVPMGAQSMGHPYFGADSAAQLMDGRGLKQVVNTNNEINLLTPRNGTSTSIVIRGTPFDGTAGGTKGATQPGDAFWIGLCGHNGTTFAPLSAGIRMSVSGSSGWSATNLGAGITFATTTAGTATRTDRWAVTGDGNFVPTADNVYTLGRADVRVAAIYAVNGTIQTSDASLKSEVRKFTDDEVKAAQLLGKEIGFFTWLAKQEDEGDEAREHVGMTVQRAIEIMRSCNLDPMHYGFICYDSWDEKEVISGYSDETTPVVGKVSAGERYSFRYDQLNLFIARGLEERLSRLEGE